MEPNGAAWMMSTACGGTAWGRLRSPSELAPEGEERGMHSSRTPSGGEDAGLLQSLSFLA
jgi:hypothetical protein